MSLRDEIALNCMAWRLESESGDWATPQVAACLAAISDAHHGDCTNVPMTCLRCEAESAYKQADSILSLLPPKGWRPTGSASPGGDYKPEFFGHEWIGEYLAQDLRDTAQSLRQTADFIDGKADLLQEQMALAAPVTKTGEGNG